MKKKNKIIKRAYCYCYFANHLLLFRAYIKV